MSAEDQIRRTLARYVQCHDDEDADGVVALFAEEGRLSVPSGARPIGRAAVRAFLLESYVRRRSANRQMKHIYADPVIDLDGRRAAAVSDWVAYESVSGGPWTVNMIGRSYDQLVLHAGEWLLTERRNVDAA